jgi:hypothetical protein
VNDGAVDAVARSLAEFSFVDEQVVEPPTPPVRPEDRVDAASWVYGYRGKY